MDVEVFKESKDSKWSVWMADDYRGMPFAYHVECSRDISDHFDKRWSWFKEDGNGTCYGCGTKVPKHIQCLVLLLGNW